MDSFCSASYLLTLLLILDAVPNSSANILATLETWSFGGMIKEIMLVPFLLTEKLDLWNMKKGHTITVMKLSNESLISLFPKNQKKLQHQQVLKIVKKGKEVNLKDFKGISYKLGGLLQIISW